MTGALSRRCSACNVHWPVAYGKCPECGEKTWLSTTEAIDSAQAQVRIAHAKFERYYAEREERQQRDAATL